MENLSKNVIKEFKTFEKEFKEDKDVPFKIFDGDGCVMFSAPHAVPHFRNGRVKLCEPESGPICMVLNKFAKCPVIVKTANFNDDANYDKDCKYKEALVNYIKNNNIKMLIDVHQLLYKRHTIINIGTSNFKNLNNKEILNILIAVFSKYKFGELQIDYPFDASNVNTVSSTVARECKIPAIQLEINSQILRECFKEERLEDFLKAIFEVNHKLNKYFEKI